MSMYDKIAAAEETSWLVDSFSPAELKEQDILADTSVIIQRRRKALDLTQSGLAKRLGVTQGLVSRWENGEENLTVETIAKIAAALDLNIQSPLVSTEPIHHLRDMDDMPVMVNYAFSQKNTGPPLRKMDIEIEWGVRDGA